MHIKSIFDISDRYDTYLVDMWGVVYDGKPFTEAIDALNQLKQQGKSIIFVSNNPRPSSLTKTILTNLGLGDEVAVMTSGEVMRQILTERHRGERVYHLGQGRNQDLLAGMDLVEIEDLTQSDFVILSCFIEENEDCTQFDAELEAIAKQHVPVYCPNPDVYAFHHQTLRKTAGFFAKRLEEQFGGTVQRIGKPYPIIFEAVQRKYPSALENKKRTLMIGDTLTTDIQGGRDFGVDTLFVQSGISKVTGETLETEDVQPTYQINILK
jgi:HAD superfamily hydrolase (TIGR01459 family)